MRKFGKILIALSILFAVLAVSVWHFAAPWTRMTGQPGEDVFYTFNQNNGTLLIYGTGEMWEFTGGQIAGDSTRTSFFCVDEWMMNQVIRLVILDGVTEFPANVIGKCKFLKEIYLPASMKLIHDGAFTHCTGLQSVCFAGDAAFLTTNALPEDNPYLHILHTADAANFDDKVWSGVWANYDCKTGSVKIPWVNILFSRHSEAGPHWIQDTLI